MALTDDTTMLVQPANNGGFGNGFGGDGWWILLLFILLGNGGRGISMCADWKNSVSSFVEWALANGYSDSLTIDRIDNDGDYTPENCRWVDSKTQSNNRRSNINITIGGETKTLTFFFIL